MEEINLKEARKVQNDPNIVNAADAKRVYDKARKNEYFYYRIPGDNRSEKILINRKELFEAEEHLIEEVCEAYKNGKETTVENQLKTTKMISISFYALGGNEPLHDASYKKTKWKCPKIVKDDYIYFFILNCLKFFHKFDRMKGCWTNYVRFAKLDAIDSTIRLLKNKDKEKDLLFEIENVVRIFHNNCKNTDSISSLVAKIGYSEPWDTKLDNYLKVQKTEEKHLLEG